MKILRTLSTTRLITLAVAACIVLVGGAVVAVAAHGGGGATPPAKPLAQAAHDSLAAAKPDGVTARITFTNKLFPSGALVGQAGSALMSGATGRLWWNPNGGRLELQSDAGDVQLTWNDTKATLFDASSNTAYTFDLPQDTAGASTSTADHAVPTVDEITKFITELGKNWTVSGAEPSNVAGQEAYTVKVSPAHDGGLLGSAQLAWAAANGVPLRVAIYARDASSPALALEATDISFGAVADSTCRSRRLRPPRSSTSPPRRRATEAIRTAERRSPGSQRCRLLPASRSLLPTRSSGCRGRTSGSSGRPTLAQRSSSTARDSARSCSSSVRTTARQARAGPLASLPKVSLERHHRPRARDAARDGADWDRGGVTYILAGSLPSSAAEAAAAAIG